MKKIISLLAITITLISCDNRPNVTYTPRYQEPYPQTYAQPQYSEDYQVMEHNGSRVVYVQNGSERFFMDYLIFQSLLNSGGWNNVYSTYHRNPSRYYNTTIVKQYSNYKVQKIYNSPQRSNYKKTNVYQQNNAPKVNNTYPSKNVYQPKVYQPKASQPTRFQTRTEIKPTKQAYSSSGNSKTSYKKR